MRQLPHFIGDFKYKRWPPSEMTCLKGLWYKTLFFFKWRHCMYQSHYHSILFPVPSTVSILIKRSSPPSTLWHPLLHLWLDYFKTGGHYNLGCAYVVTEKCLTGTNNQVSVIDVGFLKLNKCTVNWHFWPSSISRLKRKNHFRHMTLWWTPHWLGQSRGSDLLRL